MNIRLTIQYDGSKYDGWQKNKNAKQTIQEKIDETMTKYLGEPVKVVGAGRTDKGVHAKAMVANVHINKKVDVDVFQKDMNHYLPSDIYILDAAIVDERFHARYQAISKVYVYRWVKTYEEKKNVFEKAFVSELTEKVEVGAIQKAADLFVGKHDFKGFSSDKTKKSTVRELFDVRIHETEDEIIMAFEGSGFLYHMVRIMVGTLVEVGQGKRKPASITKVLENGVRSEAGFLAPAKGLILDAVKYDSQEVEKK